MIQDIIRALIQKVMHDKILMALIAIGIAGIFFSGANHSEKKESVQSKRLGRSSADQPAIPGEQGQADQGGQDGEGQGQPAGQQAGQQAGQAQNHQAQTNQAQATGGQQAAQAGLTPDLATQFVRWWLTQSMDYRMDTGAASHKVAAVWMLPDACNAFEQLYWGDHIKQGIASGTIVGAFQPVSVVPIATNPDGSVVVTVVGTLTMQQSGQQPASQQLTMDFLVKKTADGFRIAAFFNRAVAPVATP
jgi:hypothetical protein